MKKYLTARHYHLIYNSKLFDSEYYSNKYDLSPNNDCIKHYIEEGVDLGYNPCEWFDTNWYLKKNDDVKNFGMNPFSHYMLYGKDEGRLPKLFCEDKSDEFNRDYFKVFLSDEFDTVWYRETYNLGEDVDSIRHYLEEGAILGYNPSKYFDTVWYLEENLDVKEKNVNPFVHYIEYGKDEGRLPKLLDLYDDIINKDHLLYFKGEKNYFFLINDSNSELRQHYDKYYVSCFDKNKFLNDYYYKKYLFKENGIDYYYFVVPDKTVVCKDLLPFEIKGDVRRNIDLIDEIPDFADKLNYTHYFRYDTHLNYECGKILSYYFLHHMDNKLTKEEYLKILDENIQYTESTESRDFLISNMTYSTEKIELLKTVKNIKVPNPSNLEKLYIPEEFQEFGRRKSEFFYNPNVKNKLKVLVCHNSSMQYIKSYFMLFFNKIFLHWDSGYTSKELIQWYKPDIVIEIRIERFIENPRLPEWVENKEIFKI